jgi:hypothetical protein
MAVRLVSTNILYDGSIAVSADRSQRELQDHLDHMTGMGWSIEAYSTSMRDTRQIMHSFIWRKEE